MLGKPKKSPHFDFFIDEQIYKSFYLLSVRISKRINNYRTACIGPGFYPRKKVRQFIREHAKSFTSLGESYAYEEGLRRPFHLGKEGEVKDELFAPGIRPSLKGLTYLAATLPLNIISVPFYQAAYGLGYIVARTIRDPQNKYTGIYHLTLKALRDPRYQDVYGQFLLAQELPQPLNLEVEYLMEKSRRLPQGFATCAERSFGAARKLLRSARSNNLKKMHYFGSQAHMTEIAYFLVHPDYSFGSLERYMAK